MKLTQMLLKAKVWKRHRLPGGNIYKGKYRIIIPPTPLEVAETVRFLEMEDKNMFYLRHPYLTERESKEHKASWEYYNFSIQEQKRIKSERFMRPVRISEHLAHLKVSESWE